MSGTTDSFEVVSDSSFCQSTEPLFLKGTLKLDFVDTTLIEQSMTLGKDTGNSTIDFYLEAQEEGGYVAFSREFAGAVGQGETEDEALSDLKEAIKLLEEVVRGDQVTPKKE